MSDIQLKLFDSPISKEHNDNQNQKNGQLLDRFQGAIAFSAVGDALGWMTEFGQYPREAKTRINDKYPVKEFYSWKKKQGGRYWGYTEDIDAGSYSDDTQLGLSVARCINIKGNFEPEKFAYFELPLWLVYERGGGSAIKFAARSLLSKNKEWWRNFYQRKTKHMPLDYRNAGANGAAMRVLPISLVNAFNEDKLLHEAFLNSIITHGHPRAIIGTLIYAGAVSFLIKHQQFRDKELVEYLNFIVKNSLIIIKNWEHSEEWLKEWNQIPSNQLTFEQEFSNIQNEAKEYLNKINSYVNLDSNSYYELTKALDPAFRGSGVSTVLVSIFLFLKYKDSPNDALFTAVNSLGSDTDTIANFVGGLFGAHYGLDVVPPKLLEKVQDKEYLIDIARQLYQKSKREIRRNQVSTQKFERKEGLLRILAWEIGLHEMFWEALNVGDRLNHPSLGSGTIKDKKIKPLPRDDYETKLVVINFDCGQSCTFHSRVKKGAGELNESLAKEIKMNFDINQN